MCMSQSLFYLTTDLHVSGVTITHLQEHKTTVSTASGNRYTVLLSVAIVEELGKFGKSTCFFNLTWPCGTHGLCIKSKYGITWTFSKHVEGCEGCI